MAAITEKLEFVNISVYIFDNLLLKLSRPIFTMKDQYKTSTGVMLCLVNMYTSTHNSALEIMFQTV